mmetsp:Transcript_17523/g.54334  ORF Transcript_17523/g.54334 Transcript_17523/m.54334 type:complete len:226 (+) Transcript_17523:573-1250(+)
MHSADHRLRLAHNEAHSALLVPGDAEPRNEEGSSASRAGRFGVGSDETERLHHRGRDGDVERVGPGRHVIAAQEVGAHRVGGSDGGAKQVVREPLRPHNGAHHGSDVHRRSERRPDACQRRDDQHCLRRCRRNLVVSCQRVPAPRGGLRERPAKHHALSEGVHLAQGRAPVQQRVHGRVRLRQRRVAFDGSGVAAVLLLARPDPDRANHHRRHLLQVRDRLTVPA